MSLDELWAGWRSAYIESGDAGSGGDQPSDCVFCRIARAGDESVATGVVWRSDTTMAVLNAYPYASGHLLVMPSRHVGELDDLTPAESYGLWEGTTMAARALRSAYGPDGLNLGANLGRVAGAGVPGHLHMHVLPRWAGDTNFMTTVANVRVIPEALDVSWERLRSHWPAT
ncbi:MAG: HIT family protein [Acidimicrobiales bacterium]